MNAVYSWPSIVFGPVFVIIVVALSIAALFLVQKYLPKIALHEHNDITGFFIAVVGALYAVALAFIVIVVWEDFTRAEATAAHEAQALTDIYHGMQVFPAAQRDHARADIRRYDQLMLGKEWPAMQHGETSPETAQMAHRISDDVDELNPSGPRQEDEHRELLTLGQDFLDARRERLRENEDGIPPIMWWTMAFGGALTIGFALLFGGVDRRQHALMVGTLAALIAAMLVLIIEIDLPFRGDIGVSNEVWHTQIDLLREYGD